MPDEEDPVIDIDAILGRKVVVDDDNWEKGVEAEYKKILSSLKSLYGKAGFEINLHGELVYSLATSRVHYAWLQRTMIEMERCTFRDPGLVMEVSVGQAGAKNDMVRRMLEQLEYLRKRVKDVKEEKDYYLAQLRGTLPDLKPIKTTSKSNVLPAQEVGMRKLPAPAMPEIDDDNEEEPA